MTSGKRLWGANTFMQIFSASLSSGGICFLCGTGENVLGKSDLWIGLIRIYIIGEKEEIIDCVIIARL